MTEEEFAASVVLLNKKRASVASLNAQALELRTQFDRDHDDLFNRLANAKRKLAEFDHTLRQMIVQNYLDTGVKKPYPGLGVRVTMGVNYIAAQARKFAFEHMPDLLVLDTKGFKTYAKAVRDIGSDGEVGGKLGEIVTFVETPAATISKNLEEPDVAS